MTVKELIELNNFIGDITITVRGGASGGERLKEYHIGPEEGKAPPYHDNKDVYKQVAINAKDMGKDYYQILLTKIPKQWLGLTVISYRVWKASRKPYGVQHGFEHILIDVKPDGYVEKVDKTTKEKELAVEGQMNFADFPEVLP